MVLPPEMWPTSKASKIMEVQFEGETGFGVAVTQSFYAPRREKKMRLHAGWWKYEVFFLKGRLTKTYM